MKKLLLLFLFALCIVIFPSEYALADNNDIIRLGIMRFDIKTQKVSEDLKNFIPDAFTRMLAESPSIAVIDRGSLEEIAREQKLSLSGLVDVRTAVKIGHLAGCQYMLLGAITNYQSTLENQFVLLSAVNKTEITLDIRLVDVNTSEVVLALSDTGTSERDSGLLNIVSGTLKGGGKEEAIGNAVSRLGSKIREAVAGEYMQILKAGGKRVTVSVGRTSGAKKDTYYRVYAEGSEVLDMNGRSLGREVSNIAVIQIDDVQNNFSGAKVITGKPENIRRGDKIELISPSEAKRIAKSKDYSDKRPRSLGDSDLSGEALDSALHGMSSGNVKSSAVTPIIQKRKTSGNYENKSTDPAKVIETYGLSSGEANTLRIKHINAGKLGNTLRGYKAYADLANENRTDYLAAFKAGEAARIMGDIDAAHEWYDKALSINPNYEPAKRAKISLSSGAGKATKTRRNRK